VDWGFYLYFFFFIFSPSFFLSPSEVLAWVSIHLNDEAHSFPLFTPVPGSVSPGSHRGENQLEAGSAS
jgi:hypothetical protein